MLLSVIVGYHLPKVEVTDILWRRRDPSSASMVLIEDGLCGICNLIAAYDLYTHTPHTPEQRL